MTDETPNERNFRLLAERFKYDEKIVLDDGFNQYTFEMLKEVNPVVKSSFYNRYLVGNEAILFLLESERNRVPQYEIQDLINELHREVWEQYRPLSPDEIAELENAVGFPNENENGNENETNYGNEMTIDFGNEPAEITIIDLNGNELHHKVESVRYNGNENELSFIFENGNGFGNELQNELRNELGNETKNENENGLLDQLRYSFHQIKKLL